MTKHELAIAYYRQGVAALESRDFGRAAEQFRHAARLVPENVMYAQLAIEYSRKPAC